MQFYEKLFVCSFPDLLRETGKFLVSPTFGARSVYSTTQTYYTYNQPYKLRYTALHSIVMNGHLSIAHRPVRQYLSSYIMHHYSCCRFSVQMIGLQLLQLLQSDHLNRKSATGIVMHSIWRQILTYWTMSDGQVTVHHNAVDPRGSATSTLFSTASRRPVDAIYCRAWHLSGGIAVRRHKQLSVEGVTKNVQSSRWPGMLSPLKYFDAVLCYITLYYIILHVYMCNTVLYYTLRYYTVYDIISIYTNLYYFLTKGILHL